MQFVVNKTLFLDRSTAVNAANEIPLTCLVFGRLQKVKMYANKTLTRALRLGRNHVLFWKFFIIV